MKNVFLSFVIEAFAACGNLRCKVPVLGSRFIDFRGRATSVVMP